jgi:YHS domain-containing protein
MTEINTNVHVNIQAHTHIDTAGSEIYNVKGYYFCAIENCREYESLRA